jgi:L-lactate dehydrogenase complex protein LldE
MSIPGRVSLFITCVVEQFFPQVGQATVEVLERCGLQVDFPERQTCCGQPAFNTGYRDEARRVARAWMRAFRGSEAVVAPSGSCVSFVRNHFAELFHDSPVELEEARRLAARTWELTEFLVSVLGREEVGAAFEGAVGYHESCHLLRELGISRQPRALLSKVRGLELRELDLAQECCGFGGTFAVKFPELSAAMADDKLRSAARAGATTLVACDTSCLMHLDGRARRVGLPLRCLHIAEVLAGQTAQPEGLRHSGRRP